MGNSFSNAFAPTSRIRWSNAGTDDFIFTWLLAANDEAAREWEVLFTAWLGERAQVWCPPGMAGFDVLDLPWQASRLATQRDFLVRTGVAAMELLARHRGGVIASGFRDDGMRTRVDRPTVPGAECVDRLDAALRSAFGTLRTWFAELPLDALAERIAQRPVVFVTPWRDDAFPESIGALRRCVLHDLVYAPRPEERGCAMCEDHRQRYRPRR